MPSGPQSLTKLDTFVSSTTRHNQLYLNISYYISISRDIIRYMSLDKSVKLLQTIDDAIYSRLEKLAKKRGITVQELIRAVIIPSWLEVQKD